MLGEEEEDGNLAIELVLPSDVYAAEASSFLFFSFLFGAAISTEWG